MTTLDQYLDHKREAEYSFALSLIKKGICFVAVNVGGKYRFYPSRFIGYVDNTMNKHLENVEKNGIDTNAAISKAVKQKAVFDLELEKAYQDYCMQLGFNASEKGAFGVERKYWRI